MRAYERLLVDKKIENFKERPNRTKEILSKIHVPNIHGILWTMYKSDFEEQNLTHRVRN